LCFISYSSQATEKSDGRISDLKEVIVSLKEFIRESALRNEMLDQQRTLGIKE